MGPVFATGLWRNSSHTLLSNITGPLPSVRFLLPPIIFYAGLSVRKRHFFKEFLTISGFGIAGTYACFALLSLGLWLCFHGLLTFRVSPQYAVLWRCP